MILQKQKLILRQTGNCENQVMTSSGKKLLKTAGIQITENMKIMNLYS